MRVTTSIVILTGLLYKTLAAPNAPEIDKRGTFPLQTINHIDPRTDRGAALQNKCNQDNLLRSFIDPRHSASASAFCSSYIKPTIKATTTVT